EPFHRHHFAVVLGAGEGVVAGKNLSKAGGEKVEKPRLADAAQTWMSIQQMHHPSGARSRQAADEKKKRAPSSISHLARVAMVDSDVI
ncbi:MAG: hypothetical protein VXX43_11510, partial [Pseudomonadota bacterium]|nr:hypothetical protein [Pseudomonadota bacterium]